MMTRILALVLFALLLLSAEAKAICMFGVGDTCPPSNEQIIAALAAGSDDPVPAYRGMFTVDATYTLEEPGLVRPSEADIAAQRARLDELVAIFQSGDCYELREQLTNYCLDFAARVRQGLYKPDDVVIERGMVMSLRAVFSIDPSITANPYFRRIEYDNAEFYRSHWTLVSIDAVEAYTQSGSLMARVNTTQAAEYPAFYERNAADALGFAVEYVLVNQGSRWVVVGSTATPLPPSAAELAERAAADAAKQAEADALAARQAERQAAEQAERARWVEATTPTRTITTLSYAIGKYMKIRHEIVLTDTDITVDGTLIPLARIDGARTMEEYLILPVQGTDRVYKIEMLNPVQAAAFAPVVSDAVTAWRELHADLPADVIAKYAF